MLNIDLAPTFLDMGGVSTPQHMDGRSILPLLLRSHRRNVRGKWPDTFLIESSGRRETPEQILERIRAHDAMKMLENAVELKNVSVIETQLKSNDNLTQSHFSSHEELEVDDDDGKKSPRFRPCID